MRLFFFNFLIFLTILFAQETPEVLGERKELIRITELIPVEKEYYLLYAKKPIEIKVSGPKELRVHTRLLFLPKDHPDFKEKRSYKLIVEGEEKERIYSFDTEISKSTYDKKKRFYGKRRSFSIEVPKGIHRYQITLFETKSDTVAIRFEVREPKEWQEIKRISLVDTAVIFLEFSGPKEYQIRFLMKEGKSKSPLLYQLKKNGEVVKEDTSRKFSLSIKSPKETYHLFLKHYYDIKMIKIYEKRELH